MKTITKLTALVTSTLLLGGLAVPAHAAESSSSDVLHVLNSTPVTAPTAKLSFERPTVKTVTAPVSEAPQPSPEPPVEQPQTVLPQSVPTKTPPVPVQAAAVSSSRGQAIVSAALAQLGIAQDCTALVENALRAAGVAGVGDESPYSLARFGTPVSSPAPGDILIYADAGAGTPHVAIYIGNGQAVHGGFNGSTVVFSANIGSGYSAYRVA